MLRFAENLKSVPHRSQPSSFHGHCHLYIPGPSGHKESPATPLFSNEQCSYCKVLVPEFCCQKRHKIETEKVSAVGMAFHLEDFILVNEKKMLEWKGVL